MALVRWGRRIAAAAAGTAVGVLVPAVAWAHTNPVALAVGDELAKRRRSSSVKVGSVSSLLGVLCCLMVVAAIVLAVILITRRGRGGRR